MLNPRMAGGNDYENNQPHSHFRHVSLLLADIYNPLWFFGGGRMKNRTYLILLLFLTSACATIVAGTTDEVTFNSEPQGVQVTAGGKVLGKTPMTIQLDKKSGQVVEFELEGYKKQTRSLSTTLEP